MTRGVESVLLKVENRVYTSSASEGGIVALSQVGRALYRGRFVAFWLTADDVGGAPAGFLSSLTCGSDQHFGLQGPGLLLV